METRFRIIRDTERIRDDQEVPPRARAAPGGTAPYIFTNRVDERLPQHRIDEGTEYHVSACARLVISLNGDSKPALWLKGLKLDMCTRRNEQ
jgi:hypothetical protein